MQSAENLFTSTLASIRENSEAAFRRFVRGSRATRWFIAADFVTTGKERVQDAFAFSVLPYDDEIGNLFAQIREAGNNDLKKVRTVNDRMLALLASRRWFHFCFLAEKRRHALGSLASARAAIAASRAMVEAYDDRNPNKPRLVRAFRALEQDARRKGFNHRLLDDAVLMSALASVVAFLVAKHCRADSIGWFIDRDSMLTAFDGWAVDAISCNFAALCEQGGVDARPITIGHAEDRQAAAGKGTWFDDFVRLPDFIAGTMARWDLRRNVLDGSSPKFVQMAERVIAENPQVALVLLGFTAFGVVASGARAFRNVGTNTAAYEVDRAAMLDLIVAEACGEARPRPTLRERLLRTTWFIGPYLALRAP